MSQFYEKASRSWAKSFTFRVLIVIADGIVVYLLTHRLDLALSIVIIRNIVAMFLYWGHERVWNGIDWGRSKK